MRIVFMLLCFLLTACVTPSYYQTNKKAMDAYYANHYDTALAELEQNKYIKEAYNLTLYKLEKARLLYLNNKPEEAAKLLIEAEVTLDDNGKKYHHDLMGNKVYWTDNRYTIDGRPLPPPPKNSDEALEQSSYVRGSFGYAMVPHFKSAAKTTYLSTDIERPLLNYQIGLCGLALKDDKPLIEAKLLYALNDKLNIRKTPVSQHNYSPNPFLHLCSGIFFEAANEMNSAFIAYELALKSYNDSNCLANYGLKLPQQLKTDLILMSSKLGFTDRYDKYKNQFALIPKETEQPQVLLLIELNHTPRKDIGKTKESEKFPYPYIKKVSGDATNLTVAIDGVVYEAPIINNLQYQLGDAVATAMETTFYKNMKWTVSERYKNYDSRNWQTLPAQICYTKLPLKIGVQQLQVSYFADNKLVQKNVSVHMKTGDRVIPIRIID